MNLQFEYFDFIPRKEFHEQASQILQDLSEQIPFAHECEARCTYFANKFFFQITFRTANIMIAAQSILDPQKEDTSSRQWQVKALEYMSYHLKKQMESIGRVAA